MRGMEAIFQRQEAQKRTEADNRNFAAVLDRLLAEIAEEDEDNAYRLWAESAGKRSTGRFGNASAP